MTTATAFTGLALVGTIAGIAADTAAPPLPAAVGARPSSGFAARSTPVWGWPLTPLPRVVHPFQAPPSPYAAGHRGVDLAPTGSSLDVLAVDAGVVTHVGVIAGRGTVTLLHAGDIKSTYEPVTSTASVGTSFGRGAVIGSLDLVGGHCVPTRCLHLGGLRRDSAGAWNYFDPRFLLAPVEIVLLPVRG